MSQPGQALFGIESSNDSRVVIFAGGFPLKVDGQVVGAVGASGGRPGQDHEVAAAGAAAAFASACEPGRWRARIHAGLSSPYRPEPTHQTAIVQFFPGNHSLSGKRQPSRAASSKIRWLS